MPITSNLRCTKNFIAKIIKYEKICSIQNSMTVLPDLLPILIQMIHKKKTGSINLTNPGTISHNEILDLYKQYINPYFIYTNFTQEEQRNTLKSERSNNMLDTTLLESEYPNVPGIYTSIENLFKRLYELV
jgi:3,5-epimerase/4-reductase